MIVAPPSKRLRVKSITIVGELYSSKNSRKLIPNPRGTRPPWISVPSDAARKAEKPLLQQLALHRIAWKDMIEGHSLPLAIRLKIYRATHARFDYINVAQSLFDCMTKMEWIKDDNADCVIPIFDHYEVDPLHPRVVISIAGSGSEIIIRKNQPALF